MTPTQGLCPHSCLLNYEIISEQAVRGISRLGEKGVLIPLKLSHCIPIVAYQIMKLISGISSSRGISLSTKTYEIFIKTQGFLRDLS